MNKTVTINISGIIFHIEEDAYEILSKYILEIKNYFKNTEGGNEIFSDIESRIAELLQQKLSSSKQVILVGDVQSVMEVMGKPEDFAGDESKVNNDNFQTASANYTEEKIKRRLFRNPDQKVFGGVCGGLAAYFDIDVVWIRLAMFLLIFFGGLSLWVYVIMWIIIPQAKSTTDKLSMRGEAATVNTIYKNFKEEAEDVKTRMNKYGQEIRQGNYWDRVRQNTAGVFGFIFNIIGRFFGLVLLLIGIALLFIYVVSLFGFSVSYTNDGLNNDFPYW